MDPIKKILYLQLYQAEILLSRAKKYNFSDKHKVKYLDTLRDLFERIKNNIDNNYTEAKIFDYKNHLDFIFKSLQFLKDSTLNSIPFEVVGCLERAMNDWIDGSKFIIVTGLQNDLYSFSFDTQYAKNDLFYKSLDTEYGISFDKKLVQINLPSVLAKDYFSSVALYHELGHFIDRQLLITDLALFAIETVPATDPDRIELEPYFPYMNISGADRIMLYLHLGEYFCDLFASQYVGDKLIHYLEYITSNQKIYKSTHPSTVNRVKVMSDFLNKIRNPVVDLLQLVLTKITKKTLAKMFDEILSDDFYKLIPYDIKNDRELHGCISYGWEIWLSDLKKFNDVIGYDLNLADSSIYNVINNLTEKSIGNYFTINNWNANKV